MRSRSASIVALPVLGRRKLGQRRLAAGRHRTLPPGHRTLGRLRAGGERVEQRLGRGAVEVLVEIVVDLENRRVDAGAEALDLDQGELAVRGAFADADAELLLAGGDDFVGTLQPAGSRRAGLE